MATAPHIDEPIQRRIQEWLDGPFDEETKAQIRKLQRTDPHALIDAFYSDLSFGTGGLREIMGVGTHRMNIYTVRMATEGLARYLKSNASPPLSVVICYDSRHNSERFAKQAARVLAAHGIKVFLFLELRPTPYLSFACRFLRCTAGIMITASHNSAEYNGYKVYWSDGAQVVAPHDVGIIQQVEQIKDPWRISLAQETDPLIESIDNSLDEKYLQAIRPLAHLPEQNRSEGATLQIAYTSLHGTGITMVPKALTDWGFPSLHYVEKQIKPDGDFPTVRLPNPEYKEALALGIETLQRTHSDLLIATDPDADRLGVVVSHKQHPVILNGNELAALCAEFLCTTLRKKGALPKKGAIVTTIVTTELLKAIAQAHSIACVEVLTGFKYIGEKILQWETDPNGLQFLFGAEESYGYLIGTHARDKDAIVLSCLVAEMALDLKRRGETLVDALHRLWKTYGIYREKQHSISFPPGKEGTLHIEHIMRSLRRDSLVHLAGQELIAIEDYQLGVRLLPHSKKRELLTLPKSDVLLLRLPHSKLVIRPSGTEPKLKIYASTWQRDVASIEQGVSACDAHIEQLLAAIKEEMA